LARHSCIISLSSPFSIQHSAFAARLIPEGTSCRAPRSLLPAPRCLQTWKAPPLSRSRSGSKPAITLA
jgi:hypothetical protein